MPGRPRDLELERRLLAAAWSALCSEGYDALTLSRVASDAGAHRSDVYRRWGTKAQLVADVLAEHLPPVAAVDTGGLRGDARAYVEALARSWSSEWVDGLLGLVADLRQDLEAELAFRQMAERRGAPMRAALERAVARGELAEVPAPDLVGDLLEGPLMHRRVIGRAPLTPAYLDSVVSAALLVLGVAEVRR